MTPRTKICSWNNLFPHSASLEEAVSQCLGVFADDYDAEAIGSDYTDAINAALESVGTCLVGDEFIGPASHANDIEEAIRSTVAGVPIGPIVESHYILSAVTERIRDSTGRHVTFDDVRTILKECPQVTYDALACGDARLRLHLDGVPDVADGTFVITENGTFEVVG